MMYRRRTDLSGQWIRGEPVEVSQEWLNHQRNRLLSQYFRIEGDAGVTVDAGNDGIPDSGWTKKDISAWLKAKGVEFSGYATKSQLLGLVEETLNPPAPEPEPATVEEPVAEEAVEESIIGDEE
jgi:predicted metal-dependent RNase